MQVIQRTAAAEVEVDGDRSVVVTASDDSRDRMGDRIAVDGVIAGRRFGEGWKLDAFRRNPVLLFGHDYQSLPIGTVSELWMDAAGTRKRLRARMTFSRSNPMADTVLGLYKERVLRAVSVGFMPSEGRVYEPKDEKEREAWGLGSRGVVFGEQELWELSCVPVPANPGAVVEGIDDQDRAALVELAAAAQRAGHEGAAQLITRALKPRATDPSAALRRAMEATRAAIRERDADPYGDPYGDDF